jgi:hypothetical protein
MTLLDTLLAPLTDEALLELDRQGCLNGAKQADWLRVMRNGLRRLLAPVVAEWEQAQAWQPIATAPTIDSTWRLVLLADGDVRRAHWASDLSGSEQPAFQGWFVQSGRSFVGVTPTHWLSLPPAPPGGTP